MHKFLLTTLSTIIVVLTTFSISNATNTDNKIEVIWPEIVVSNIEYEVRINHSENNEIQLLSNGKAIDLSKYNGYSLALIKLDINTEFQLFNNREIIESKVINPIPLWLSILPPLLAITFALIFREVIISLFFGIYLGALFPAIYVNGFTGLITALFTIIDHYIINALYNTGHLSVIVFSMVIGATVSLISKNGGMAGVVNRLSIFAKNRRSGQLVTWFLGIVIFFDDYANTLIVGNTMRPITDKLKISREKLSYIVDSTAAPIAAIAFVTTWIGAELGYIQDGVNSIDGLNSSVYHIFLNSLQYSFYPIFTLIFIGMLIWMKKDFGPMHSAEKRAISDDENTHEFVNVSENEMNDFEPSERIVKKSYNAVIPVTTIVLVTISGLLYSGWSAATWENESMTFVQKLSDTIGNADPYLALLWSSLSGLLVAAILTLSQRILSVQETVGSVINGFKTMLTAMIILILAWSLSAVTEDLHTAEFLTISVSGSISPYFIPLATFILSSLVSFSTGSSWGTMAILYPMMLPLSWTICIGNGLDNPETLAIFYNVVSCVLAGSVLGDHCSPISDTTILSSLASSCNHIEHVRTQLPYALTVGAVAIFIGTIPASYGLPFYVSLTFGIAAMYLIIKKFGKEII